MATLQEWEEAVRTSYRSDVTSEEYEAKATDQAVRKVAYYMQGCDYEIDLIISDAPASMVMLLLDFQAFTEGV